MTAPTGKTPLPGSERAALDRPPIGDVPGSEPVDAMVTLRPDIDDEGLHRVIRFLEDHGLTVENSYEQTKTLHVRGPAAGMQAAFSVRLARYFGESGDQFRGRSGPILRARRHRCRRDRRPGSGRPEHRAPVARDRSARRWRRTTDSPAGGEGLRVPGRGRSRADRGDHRTGRGIHPEGPRHLSGRPHGAQRRGHGRARDGRDTDVGRANGADGEVMLDVEIIAALAPGANVRMYFGSNTTAGCLAAINQAIVDGAHVISISWGGPESTWTHQAMKAYDQTFATALSGGCSVFAASGDNGSSDRESVRSLKTGGEAGHLRRDHRLRCRYRSAPPLFPPTVVARILHGNHGRTAPGVEACFQRQVEAGPWTAHFRCVTPVRRTSTWKAARCSERYY